MFAPDDAPIAHPEHHGDRVVAIARVADDVGVAGADRFDGGRRLHLVEPLERVAEVARPLEVLPLAGREHQCADPGLEVDGAPLEEIEHLGDHAAIVGRVLPAHAWRPAAADVIVEARALALGRRQVVVARADGEHPADEVERAAHLADVGVRAEVARAGNVAPPRHQHPRKRLADGHGDRGIALVVLEPHVEARLVFLDEVVLEQQRLRLVRHDDRLDVGDAARASSSRVGESG